MASAARRFCRSRPAAIFLTKFENANPKTRAIYAQHNDAGKTLVATLKSSGSLWLVGTLGKRLVFTSKNGAQNPFASAGLHLLVRQLQCQWGADWKAKYEELIDFLDAEDLSLGCECVSSQLGSHGQLPREDHIVVNAIIDRRSLSALSPLALLDFSERFRILTTGFYIFRDGRKFETIYDAHRNERALKYSDIHAELARECDGFHEFDYNGWQGDLLEGFVTFFIEPESLTDEDLTKIRSSTPIRPVAPSTPDCLPLLSELIANTEEDAEVAAGQTDVVLSVIRDLIPVHTFTRQTKEEAKRVMDSQFGSDVSSTQFSSMFTALHKLNIRYDPKVFRVDDIGDTFLLCVHIAHDDSFIKYENYRQASKLDGLHLPPLLRGNFWVLSMTAEEVAVREPVPQSPPILRHIHNQPIPGSIWKFKLFCYICRTFLYRNAGTNLLKHRDPQRFIEQVATTMRLFQIHSDTQRGALEELRKWGNFLLQLSDDEATKMRKNYLELYENFLTVLPDLPDVAPTKLKAVLLLFAVSEAGKAQAQEIARALTGSKAVPPTTDEKQLALLANGSVILSEFGEKALTPMLKTGLRNVGARRVVVCTLDTTEDSFAAANPSAPDREIKKFRGISESALRVAASAGAEIFNCVRDPATPVDEFMAGIQQHPVVVQAIAKACEEEPLTPVRVVLFVTMAGLGKNSIIDNLLQRENFKEMMGYDRKECVTLEKDALRDGYSKELEKSLANLKNRLIFINKNTPPNSYRGTILEISRAASRSARELTVLACVPESEGTPGNGFTLLDAAICYRSIFSRASHPMGLCGGSDVAEKVLAMFYQTYRVTFGRPAMMQQLQSELTENIIEFPWVRRVGPEEQTAIDEVSKVMDVLVSANYEKMPNAQRDRIRTETRQVLEKHASFLDSLRLPLPEVVDRIAASFRSVDANAIVHGAQTVGGYISVEIAPEKIWPILDVVYDAHGEVPRREHREKYHVTLWHSKNIRTPPPDVVNLIGKSVKMNVVAIGHDDQAQALLVGDVTVEDSEAPVSCPQTHPHVTIWTDKTVDNVYSNQLLASVPLIRFDSPFVISGVCVKK